MVQKFAECIVFESREVVKKLRFGINFDKENFF